MARQTINIGTTANDGTGDGLRTAFDKCNDNFAELYNNVRSIVPSTNIGSPGDTAGDLAFDLNHLYVCFQDYDGSSEIWRRVALSAF